MKVVANSTVLIFISKINRLDLLEVMEIYSTEEVKKEVLSMKEINPIEKENLEKLFSEKINIVKDYKKMNLGLDLGEESAISVCINKKIPVFLSDDKKARRVAEYLSIDVIGTLGIIFINFKNKIITKEEARELLKKLISNSYYISAELYAKVLEEIGF